MHPILQTYLIVFPFMWVFGAAVWQYKDPPQGFGDYVNSAVIGFIEAIFWPVLLSLYLFAKSVNILVERFLDGK